MSKAISQNNKEIYESATKADPIYRAKYDAIVDLINFKNEHIDYTEKIYELKKGDGGELGHEIKKLKRERSKLAESFYKKYEHSPYNPTKIPLASFPEELRHAFDEANERLASLHS